MSTTPQCPLSSHHDEQRVDEAESARASYSRWAVHDGRPNAGVKAPALDDHRQELAERLGRLRNTKVRPRGEVEVLHFTAVAGARLGQSGWRQEQGEATVISSEEKSCGEASVVSCDENS